MNDAHATFVADPELPASVVEDKLPTFVLCKRHEQDLAEYRSSVQDSREQSKFIVYAFTDCAQV